MPSTTIVTPTSHNTHSVRSPNQQGLREQPLFCFRVVYAWFLGLKLVGNQS